MRAIFVVAVLPFIMGGPTPAQDSAPSTTTSREFLLPAPESPSREPVVVPSPEPDANDSDECSVAQGIREHLSDVGETIEAYREHHGINDATSEGLKQKWLLVRELEQELRQKREQLEIAETWLEGNDDPVLREKLERLRRHIELFNRNVDRLRNDLVALEHAYRVEQAMVWARDMVKVYLQSRDWSC